MNGYEKNETINANSKLPVWQEGYLDIHHINTGGGDAAFFIFPDGTTMLFDAGDMDQQAFNKKWVPLKATALHPSDSLSAGQWIVHYIKQVMPRGRLLEVDYAAISHFHSDHYGNVRYGTGVSETGAYKITGITEVAEHIPIGRLIDRGSPDYNYPVKLKEYYENFADSTFLNYLDFVNYRLKNKMSVERLSAGSRDQIKLRFSPDHFPSFKVRNVKSNGLIWTGSEDNVFEYFQQDSILNGQGRFNENPLSLGIKISYGAFDYFTGGDMTGMQGHEIPGWFDVETPVSAAVGRTEVMTLNHHGNRDATNHNFVQALDPQVVVQQSWCSDHPGQEVFHRLRTLRANQHSRDIFATNIHQETKVTMGPWFTNAYKSMEGHIFIRVSPGGGEYFVYILDDNEDFLKVKNKYGPYVTEE